MKKNKSGISHENCISILSRTQNSYNIVNDEPLVSRNIGSLSNVCKDDQLILTYKYNLNINTIDLPDSEIRHIEVALYPPNTNKTNKTTALMNGGQLSISSNNKENDMNKYLSDKLGVSNEVKTSTSSTGYKISTCGDWSNGSSCGSLTMAQYLNELLNAPDEMWASANIEFKTTDFVGRGMSEKDFKSICSKFTCTQKGDKTYAISKK